MTGRGLDELREERRADAENRRGAGCADGRV